MFTRLLMVAGALIVPIVLSVSSQVLADPVNAPELSGSAVSVVVTEAVDPAAAETTERGEPREVLQDPRSGAVSAEVSTDTTASPEAPAADAGDGAGSAPVLDDPADDTADDPADDTDADDAEVGGDDADQ